MGEIEVRSEGRGHRFNPDQRLKETHYERHTIFQWTSK